MRALRTACEAGGRAGLDVAMASLLAKQGVQRPASTDVHSRLAAMSEDGGVVAPGVFEGVGQHWQAVKGPVVVDRLGQLEDRAVVPGKPRLIKGHGAVGIAEDVSE